MAELSYYTNNLVDKVGLRFLGKKMYYDDIISQNQDSYLDLWYSKPLYGKVDTNFNLVESAAAKLGLLENDRGKEKYYALDFVADAFNGMREYMRSLHAKGRILPSAFFYPLQAFSGWVSPVELYRAHIERVYEMFKDRFLEVQLSRKVSNKSITNFDTYLPVFVEFLNALVSVFDLPLTRSGFILKKAPYASSGLMIEIASENDPSDDYVKYSKYFSDPQFPLYIQTAADFGFYVDMNMPWRLAANLESPAWKEGGNPALKQILDNRLEGGYTSQRMFEQHYYRPEGVCFQEFKLFVLAFYNSFVDKEPSFDTVKVCFKRSSYGLDPIRSVSKVVGHKSYRNKISMQEMLFKYNDLFWLRLYMQLRLGELGANLSQHQMKHELREVEQRYASMGLDSTMQYISERMTFYLKEQLGMHLTPPGEKRISLTPKKQFAIML